MCNLYSMTKNVDAIRRLFDALNSSVGNLPSMPGIFPDYPAPIVRNVPDGREVAMARWGMPSSSEALMKAAKKRAEKLQGKGKTIDFKELLRMEPKGGTTNSLFGALIKMAILLSVQAILTVMIFTFTLTLQEFVYALTFVSSSDQKPITLGVSTDLIRGDVFFWGKIMAGALIAAVPVAIAYNLFLDRFIAGITGGAVK